MNATLIEIGPNLVAALNELYPESSPVEQIELLLCEHDLQAQAERDALRAELSALTAKLDATRAACEAVLAFSRTYDNLLGHIPNADQTRLVRQLRAALA